MQGNDLTMYDTLNRLSLMLANDVRGNLGNLV